MLIELFPEKVWFIGKKLVPLWFNMSCYQHFFEFLRAGLLGEDCERELTAEEWAEVYRVARQQSLLGVIWTVAKDRKLPMELAMRWMSEAETIRGLNQLLNDEAARLTKLFAEAGRRSVILKGQANARLYRDPMSRQSGDIDIWVEGGRESVTTLVKQLGMMVDNPLLKTSYHHLHLPPNERGVTVEVHFLPSSGNFNPMTNRRLQRWLGANIQQSGDQQLEFGVPSTRFALMMQLAHILHHFLAGGIGLRQVCDYYWLLQTSTEEDRREVAGHLKEFGLLHGAGALMWVLGEVLHLDEKLMLCNRDDYRGQWMLREIMTGGNFGRYADRQKHGVLRRVLEGRLRRLKLMRFDFWEALWVEIKFWKIVVKTLPLRIRYRTLSLRNIKR